MTTMEMVKTAKEDDLIYESNFGSYDADNGFEFSKYGKDCITSDPDKFITMLFSDDSLWTPLPKKKQMTMSEVMREVRKNVPVEKLKELLGYDFDIVTEKKKNPDTKESESSVYDLLDFIFGGSK